MKVINVLDIQDSQIISKIENLRQQFISGLNNILKIKNSEGFAITKNNIAKQKCVNLQSSVNQNITILSGNRFDLKKNRKICVVAPLKIIVEKLAMQGFYHVLRSIPISNKHLLCFNDGQIITFFFRIMEGLLNYYRPVDNFRELKGVILGLRQSCLLTLANKHKKSIQWAYQIYGLDVSIELFGQKYALPTERYIDSLKSKFILSEVDSVFNLDVFLHNFKIR